MPCEAKKKLNEYQATEVFAEAGIPTPPAKLASTVEEAVDAAEEIGYPVAVKAQVHVGGRGKAGGIELTDDAEEVRAAAESIIGMDPKGLYVDRVLVEGAVDFINELYVGVTMDRGEVVPPLRLQAFDPAEVAEARDAAPQVPRSLVVAAKPAARIERAVELDCERVAVHKPLCDAARVEQAHAAGLAVDAWTITDRERAPELASAGVDGLISDVPDVLPDGDTPGDTAQQDH